MKPALVYLSLFAIVVTSCATTVTAPEQPPITIDGDVSDWQALGVSPVIVDPAGDTHPEFAGADLRAIYFARDTTALYFYVAYVDGVVDPAYAARLWIDADDDGDLDEHDYQIEVTESEVSVQTLADPFEGYLDVRAGAAALPTAVEFWVNADDLPVGDDFELSGTITYLTDSGVEFVDAFSSDATTTSRRSIDQRPDDRTRSVLPTAADVNTIEETPFDEVVYDELVLINDPEISKYAFYYFIPSHVTDDDPVRTVVVGNGNPRPESYQALATDMRHSARRYADYCDDHGYAMIKLLVPGAAQYFHRELIFADPDPDDPLVRPDLEIASIIGAFIARASGEGLDMHPRVFMTGGSNGGIQANYFPVLHPHLVEATAIGFAGIYIYPMIVYKGTRLPYPAGIADIDEIDDISFSMGEFRRIGHLIAVGENDTAEINDPIGILDEPLATFYVDEFGTTQADRVAPYAEYLQSVGMDASAVVYPGLGHGLTNEWTEATFRFFDSALPRNRSETSSSDTRHADDNEQDRPAPSTLTLFYESYDPPTSHFRIDLQSYPDYVWDGDNVMIIRALTDGQEVERWSLRFPPLGTRTVWQRGTVPPYERFDLEIIMDKNENGALDDGEAHSLIPDTRRLDIRNGVEFVLSDSDDTDRTYGTGALASLKGTIADVHLQSTSTLDGSTGTVRYSAPRDRPDVLYMQTDLRVRTDRGSYDAGTVYLVRAPAAPAHERRFLKNMNRTVRNQDAYFPEHIVKELEHHDLTSRAHLEVEGVRVPIPPIPHQTTEDEVRLYLASDAVIDPAGSIHVQVDGYYVIAVVAFSPRLGIVGISGLRRFRESWGWDHPDLDRFTMTFSNIRVEE